jgi:PAS domain S-box-containing protein
MPEQGKYTVLNVDDDEAGRYATSQILRSHAFEVVEADDGATALTLARKKPDLVLLDVNLPDMSGFAVCRALQADPNTRRIPILFLSATYVDDSATIEGLGEGAGGYLTHPIEPPVLIAYVKALLRSRRAEAQALDAATVWRTTFDAMDNRLCVVDAKGRILQCNEAMSRALNARPEDLEGLAYYQVLPAEAAARGRSTLAGVLETGCRQSTELHLSDGWWHTLASPVVDASGRLTGAVLSSEDITERKRAEHALREAKHSLERRVDERTAELAAAIKGLQKEIAEREMAEKERRQIEEQLRHTQKMDAVGQLAAGVAHEFNNLLVGILTNARLLRTTSEDDLPEGPAQPLETIIRSGERAEVLVRQLLTFSGRKETSLTLFDLNQVVADMQGILRPLIGERVTLEVSLSTDLKPVKADPTQFEIVITNLVVNARDAMPGGGAIKLSTANVAFDEKDASRKPDVAPGAYVELSVTDTGSGMAPETIERVFEPFFTTKPAGQGTGLGLSTVFAIIKHAGGNVTIESHVGKGTDVRVYLPQAEGSLAPSDAADPGLKERDYRGNETILLCDDEEVVLDSYGRLLESRGYTVIAARNGKEALELGSAHAGEISLLVTDATMPGMGGPELAERLTRKYPDLRVICMSGYAASDRSADGAEPPGIKFLKKPSTPATLFGLIRKLLDRG